MNEFIAQRLNQQLVGDALNLLPDFPDRSVDLILTDPPYDFDYSVRLSLQTEFMRISKYAVIVFCPPENQWMLPADQYLFWIKPISTKNTRKSYSRFVEMILIYGDGIFNSDRHWSQYTNVFTDLVDDASNHPHRKPPSLIERLIRNHTNYGNTILDPFCGSGVILETALKLGRNFIGIDKEDILNTRISHE